MSKILTIALFILSLSAQARELKSGKVLAHYQKRPILALSDKEQKVPVAKQIGLLRTRANLICEFLRQPAGSFRDRRAEDVLTENFRHNGKMAVLEKQSDGSIRATLKKVERGERPEVFKSLRCVGVK